MLTPGDVTDILDALDVASRERAQVPAWDGDTSDDIACYQKDLADLLAATTGAARAALERDNSPREEVSRAYIAIALSSPPPKSPWWRRLRI
jgi:hypothetical protein